MVANPKKQAQNDQIFTKTRPMCLLEQIETENNHKISNKAIRKTEICEKQPNFS